MRLPASTTFLRRWPLFGPAVLLLILVAVSAAIWAGTSPAGAQDSGELRVSVTADPSHPEVNESTRLTATIANPPSATTPSYDWEIDFGGTWYSYGSGPTFQYGNGKAETLSFRVTVSYGTGESATSDPVAVTWVDPTQTPEPTPTPTPEPTPTPTPESTEEPTPEPTPEPTEEPTPTPAPAPEPTQEPTPTPPPAPSVARVAVTSDAGADDTYILGEVIRIALTFSEAVEVTGTPRLKIDMDPAEWGEKWAGYESGSGTASLVFAHTVVEPNYSTQGIAVLEDTLELNGGTIKSAASDADAELAHDGRDHDPEHKVDWRQAPITTPTVSGVAITSDAGDEDTYLRGDVVRITLTFSERVNVTGTPQLKIDMDPGEWGEKQAAYHSGSGTASLTFVHTVVEPNLSTQGIAILENSLELNGGAIKSASSDTDAELSHDGRDHDPDHKVDWQRTRPNRAPVVNEQAKYYDWFTGNNNAPRGVLVSKPFYQVFSDPDGDELTYAVSIPEEHRQLVEEIVVTLDKDFRPETRGWPPVGTYDRVFFQAADDAEWKAVSPALADPVAVTATLTATDPEGLSVSLDGDFLVWWESHPEVVSAVAGEQAIELTFDVAVEDDPGPTAGQFTVNVVNGDGTAGTVAVTGVSVNGAVVMLNLETALATGQSVTVDYAHAAGTPLKRDSEGGDLAPDFQGQVVEPAPSALRLGPALDGDGKLRPLTVAATWDPVPDASSHTLRWRRSNGEFQAEDQLTLDAAETNADFTVSEGGKYKVELQSYGGDDNDLIAMASNQMEVQSYLRGHVFLIYELGASITGVEAYPVYGGVEVRWNNPRWSSITKYQYKALHSDEWHEYKSRGWTDAPGTGASTTSYTVTGLDDGETYAVWLRAVTEKNTYTFNHYVIVTTPQYIAVDPSTYGTTDYDTDDDGLIEIVSADQLNAIRWDLDGDGAVATDALASYGAAFSGRLQGMGCPDSGCKGYEIGTGAAGEAAITIDLDVAPYNTGAGWAPMGPFISVSDPYGFSAILEGNGNVIDNLFIKRTLPNGGRLGLFDTIASEGKVRNLGFTNVNVTGSNQIRGNSGIRTGALAGRNAGLVRNCYSTGTVRVSNSVSAVAGGLVGYNRYGKVYASHSSASVAASNIVGGHLAVGGLIGYGWKAQVAASYATGSVTVTDSPAWYGGAGGLVGRNMGSSIRVGYSTGAVTLFSTSGVLAGGLVGENSWSYGSDGIVTDSYYNSETSGQSDSGKGIAKTTAELQSPTGYTGIYANWNLDVDGDVVRDNPWNFGTSSEYPTLN